MMGAALEVIVLCANANLQLNVDFSGKFDCLNAFLQVLRLYPNNFFSNGLIKCRFAGKPLQKC